MRNVDSCHCWRCTFYLCKMRNRFLVNFKTAPFFCKLTVYKRGRGERDPVLIQFGEKCSDGSHVDAIWDSVLVVTTCGLVGWSLHQPTSHKYSCVCNYRISQREWCHLRLLFLSLLLALCFKFFPMRAYFCSILNFHFHHAFPFRLKVCLCSRILYLLRL
jgi:hypothetical protein